MNHKPLSTFFECRPIVSAIRIGHKLHTNRFSTTSSAPPILIDKHYLTALNIVDTHFLGNVLWTPTLEGDKDILIVLIAG